MPDIEHSLQIEAKPEQIYPLFSSGSGFTKWWAKDVTKKAGGRIDIGFFDRSTVYSFQLKKTSKPRYVEWLCRSKEEEWNGTRILFDLKKGESNAETILRFSHAGWKARTEYFVSCNTVWGELMFRLKSVAENRKRTNPLFAKSDWNP